MSNIGLRSKTPRSCTENFESAMINDRSLTQDKFYGYISINQNNRRQMMAHRPNAEQVNQYVSTEFGC